MSLMDIYDANCQLSSRYRNLMNTNVDKMTCNEFLKMNKFYIEIVTKLELEFPIAFSILVYKHLYQFQVLLRTIYRRSNFYCIHVDLDANPQIYSYARKASKCLKNVHLAPKRIRVTWGTYSTLEAERMCQIFLMKKFKTWKYYMNVAGTELPLRTNYELVKILKYMNGSNDVLSRLNMSPERHTRQSFDPIPGNLTISKGEFHTTLSRAFVEYVYKSRLANKFLEWLSKTPFPDEHFYSTLNRLPTFPGHARVDYWRSRFVTRYKIWVMEEKRCKSQLFTKKICQLGWQDLPSIIRSKRLFVNKFNQQHDFIGIVCMEKWLHNRIMHPKQIQLERYKDYPPFQDESEIDEPQIET